MELQGFQPLTEVCVSHVFTCVVCTVFFVLFTSRGHFFCCFKRQHRRQEGYVRGPFLGLVQLAVTPVALGIQHSTLAPQSVLTPHQRTPATPVLMLPPQMVLVSAFRSVWSVFLTQISFLPSILPVGLPWRLNSKESACHCRKRGFVPGWGRAPGEGNSNPLQYSCLENPTGRGAWWAAVHQVAESQTRLSDFTTAAALRIRLESHCLRPLDLTPGASTPPCPPLFCVVLPRSLESRCAWSPAAGTSVCRTCGWESFHRVSVFLPQSGLLQSLPEEHVVMVKHVRYRNGERDDAQRVSSPQAQGTTEEALGPSKACCPRVV